MSFVQVPEELSRVVGEPLPGTRMYRMEGPEDHVRFWTEAVLSVFGICLSPGGAAAEAGVSRAAVYQRLKDGNLTGFFYYSTKPRRSLFGRTQVKRELMVGLVPISECRDWRQELEDRAIKQGLVTAEQLEGDKPDWVGWFMDWNSDFAKEREKGAKK